MHIYEAYLRIVADALCYLTLEQLYSAAITSGIGMQRIEPAQGFWDRFVRPGPVRDVGCKGGNPPATPLFRDAIGTGMDRPGYNGIY